MKLINTNLLISLLLIGAQANDFDKAYQSLNSQALAKDLAVLASDEFEGRSPTSQGEKRTIDYLTRRLKAVGFQPGNGDSYLQKVPLLSITAKPGMTLSISGKAIKYRKDFVANTRKEAKQVDLKRSELVFVGYGIVAPEYRWNDYAGLDVKGKTVVILVNDPGFATGDPKLFQGNTMTYYGRWTYKYEEAARQGAAGAIIVHETKPASYGWNVVQSSWTGPQFQLVPGKNSDPVVDAEMWLSKEATIDLFQRAGRDFLVSKEKAKAHNFKGFSLGLNASISIKNFLSRSVSNNVIATLPGRKYPNEHVLYTAHWDHLGKVPGLNSKQIYNGAHDNASGTAGLLSIGQAFAQLKQRPERSITLLAVTAEEQGLLGSKYYASNPIIPLNKTVAGINMDSLNILGRFKDVSVTGFGKSELENYLRKAAKRQDRTLVSEQYPERGYYYRSDHFSLAIKGVPALSAGGGIEARPGNAEKQEAQKARMARCYHQTCDEYSQDWDLSGAVEDLQIYFEMGYDMSNERHFPNWNAGTEFKAIRDNSMK